MYGGYHVGPNYVFPHEFTNTGIRYCIDGYDGKEYYPVCGKCLDKKCPGAAKMQPLYVTDVSATSSYTVDLTISYSDGSSKTTTLSKNTKYLIKYVQDGQLLQVVGIITAIGKVNNTTSCTCDCCNTEDYLIKLDCSSEYSSSVVIIKSSTIRDISVYTKYADEDTTIQDSVVRGATLIGRVESIKILEATITLDGIVTKGKIVKGAPDCTNAVVADGCATGENEKGHTIVVINGTTLGGNIMTGQVTSGKVYSYIITDGETDPETGTVTNCTVEAEKGMLIATSVSVIGGTTTNGTVIDPTLNPSMVAGGTRIGTDLVTTGAIVIDGIAYGGNCEGGVLYGGTATGEIDGRVYTIEEGVTKGGYSNKCTVTGGTVKGGTIIGNTIVGATVYGGTAECGITMQGVTTLGEEGIIRAGTFQFPEGLITTINAHANTDVAAFEKDIDNLVVWWTSDVGGFHFGTNIGTTQI